MPEPGDGGLGYSWFVLELTSEDVPVPSEAHPRGGSSGEEIYGGGPWMRPWEQAFTGSVDLHKETEQVVATGEIGIRTQLFAQAVQGSARMQRSVAIEFDAVREPAHHWNQLLVEDEELLLSL